MITKEVLEDVLKIIGYTRKSKKMVYEKNYPAFDCSIKVDFDNEEIIYPEEKGMHITRKTTCNFSEPENFVVLECITRLLDKGYRPEHIQLEKEWTLGHEKKSGFADICVKDAEGKTLVIIECKTFGKEYQKEYNNTLNDGGQLFSYWQQEGSCRWLVLYASEFNNSIIEYKTDSIDCSDDNNILVSAKKDTSIKLYKDAHTAEELFEVWDETYEKRFCGDVIFRDDTKAYQIGIKPLRKVDLKDFSENDKIVNRFEEILRHNNVSDKENAFNRLIALFICKLVDEIQKGDKDEVEFQYKVGTDTYESLQDRLQRLHKEGMEKFMREEIFYVSDNYAEDLVQQYTGHKRQKMIDDLKRTLRILKFYTNNDFAFKDVHNEQLFYQNGKILVEVVQLFENYRIIGSSNIQMLGDLFEQLLNKGFKQNEGQFFTPIPITRFIWDSLPLDDIVRKDDATEYPKIMDYACGAGHFLTQGFESVNACIKRNDPSADISRTWAESRIYGIEKDYRLARVSKISLFMHGAGDGNIIFGDGLENYKDKNIIPNTFDILVANPPYSVAAFKPHLKLKDNKFDILPKISNNGSEIETLFVERISQLIKPRGIAAVVLPSSILNKENESFIAAREKLLTNFYIRAIALFGSKTFGATGTNTVVLFLEKFSEPPKRIDLISDSVQAIFEDRSLDDWEDKEILDGYIKKIDVDIDVYKKFLNREVDYSDWNTVPYFAQYVTDFVGSAVYVNKTKQKTFEKASDAEKLKWYNQYFYDFASAKESEKLTYYALCYQQTTLIISAPDENKEQETFLGYKWSNRKGQEGIQIIRPGGLLYNDGDRTDDNTIAGIVRNSFNDKRYSIKELEDYYYYLRLQDMLDFSGVDFNKSIKTTRTRDTNVKVGMTAYKLNSDSFDISIGNRVLSTEIVDDGAYPVYSANVFEEFGRINKQNITDFSKPSIIWGIDGDWMVNCIPANRPFYPTDHCGVLRLNTDDILPEYLAISLQVEGEYEKFSRSNRASTQRIKSLTVQVPDKAVQQTTINEVSAINEKIRKEEKTLSDLTEDIKSKFIELFGKPYPNPSMKNGVRLDTICENLDSMRKPITEHLRVKGQVPYYGASGVVDYVADYIFDEELLLVSEDGANLVSRKTPIAFSVSGKSWVNNHAHILRFSDLKLQRYIETYINVADLSEYINKNANPKLTQEKLNSILISMPGDDDLDIFISKAESIDKLRFKALSHLNELRAQREQTVNKYFR
jgi:type I restriction-modification system DNA methylase subunit